MFSLFVGTWWRWHQFSEMCIVDIDNKRLVVIQSSSNIYCRRSTNASLLLCWTSVASSARFVYYVQTTVCFVLSDYSHWFLFVCSMLSAFIGLTILPVNTFQLTWTVLMTRLSLSYLKYGMTWYGCLSLIPVFCCVKHWGILCTVMLILQCYRWQAVPMEQGKIWPSEML